MSEFNGGTPMEWRAKVDELKARLREVETERDNAHVDRDSFEERWLATEARLAAVERLARLSSFPVDVRGELLAAARGEAHADFADTYGPPCPTCGRAADE